MTLSDQDILELNELCNAVVDGAITDVQHARLAHWLSTSSEARQFYVRVTGLSASLHNYAAEMQSEGPDAAAQPSPAPTKHRWWWQTLGVLAVAASFSLVFWLTRPPRRDVGPTQLASSAPTTRPATVATDN